MFIMTRFPYTERVFLDCFCDNDDGNRMTLKLDRGRRVTNLHCAVEETVVRTRRVLKAFRREGNTASLLALLPQQAGYGATRRTRLCVETEVAVVHRVIIVYLSHVLHRVSTCIVVVVEIGNTDQSLVTSGIHNADGCRASGQPRRGVATFL